MEITDIDPLQNGLLFERFLNPERVTMPDIDIDFCMNRRGEVIEYVTRKYGREQVAQIITFNTMAAQGRHQGRGPRARHALRRRGPHHQAGPRDHRHHPRAGARRTRANCRQAYENDPQVRELIDTARKLEGLARGAGVHAAGVVISPQPLTELVPL